MKILSIDTASNICGVSIVENKKSICYLDTNTGRTHSENLMPMISNAFKTTKLTLNDIDLIACDIGPGSFTGIRIGIATAKAFVDSLQIPYVGITSLETLAYSGHLINPNIETICSIIDCKNNNCYYSLYQFRNNICMCIIKPCFDNIQNILHTLETYNNILFIGDGSLLYKNLITSTLTTVQFVPDNKNVLNSYSLALAGLEHFSSLGCSELVPLYLRKPQAQRETKNKSKSH